MNNLAQLLKTLTPIKVIDRLNEQVASIARKLIYNASQIHTLEKMRDTLLPKLMSEEIRIKYE